MLAFGSVTDVSILVHGNCDIHFYLIVSVNFTVALHIGTYTSGLFASSCYTYLLVIFILTPVT